ncbi:hypothetical protein P154DRAFT_520149 [Amniculicola lignicola CBS 123094]|uniref:PD-(D/E)XK nuclease-like domain-containing protein n=1 Tax=Amniculicola lignicola CBS 123094 TaxID=1392246 RepID=A0A6A5WNS2_9PLEO|nr:hypothetical protein P154DRAFT_520149 [Amniculicola lignicola CBS 123094]
MATPPNSQPSSITETNLRVESWITQLPPSLTSNLLPAKAALAESSQAFPTSTRKRALSDPTMSMSRDNSPEKRQRLDDSVYPSQSVSTAGSSTHPLSLSRHNTFSPVNSRTGASTPRRSNSPSRETIATLKDAVPPIITEQYNGARLPPGIRDTVKTVMRRLGPKQVVEGYIPYALKGLITSDAELGEQDLDNRAFAEPALHHADIDLGTESHASLQYTWKKVKRIFQRARTCKECGCDENTWSHDIIRPLVKLALRLSTQGELRIQSVQSQAIDPPYLSVDKVFKKRLDRKADFTLLYTHEHPPFEGLYDRMRPYISSVSHMSDTFTKMRALFAGIEAKAADGDKLEAEYQISIWMAASLRKKAELAMLVGLPLTDSTLLIEPAFVVVGHEWYFYLACLQPGGTGTVHILAHESCSTSSIDGIFRLLKVLRNVVEYGVGEAEDGGGDGVGYWGGFLGPTLERIAHGEANMARGRLKSVATVADEEIRPRSEGV